jgi:hypothetical protein
VDDEIKSHLHIKQSNAREQTIHNESVIYINKCMERTKEELEDKFSSHLHQLSYAHPGCLQSIPA